jgi:Tol biopolymer transport system component
VVFSSCRNGNHDIFSKGVEDDVTGNLTSLTQLTDHPADDLYPTLSPDGSWLAFASFRHGNTSEIYRVEVDDTSNIVRLTTNTVNDGHPDYCWKVNKLAFDSQRDGNWGIYIMDSGHFEEQVQLVSKSESIYRDIYPIWSSNGRSISFLSNRLNVISSPDGLKPFWVYVNGCVSEEPKGWLSTP